MTLNCNFILQEIDEKVVTSEKQGQFNNYNSSLRNATLKDVNNVNTRPFEMQYLL